MDTHVLILSNIQRVNINGHTCINVFKYPASHYKWTHMYLCYQISSSII